MGFYQTQGTGYDGNARIPNTNPAKQQVRRAPVIRQKYQNARVQYRKKSSQSVRTGNHNYVPRRDSAQETQYQTRSNWTQSYGREYSTALATQNGLYRPPHRRYPPPIQLMSRSFTVSVLGVYLASSLYGCVWCSTDLFTSVFVCFRGIY